MGFSLSMVVNSADNLSQQAGSKERQWCDVIYWMSCTLYIVQAPSQPLASSGKNVWIMAISSSGRVALTSRSVPWEKSYKWSGKHHQSIAYGKSVKILLGQKKERPSFFDWFLVGDFVRSRSDKWSSAFIGSLPRVGEAAGQWGDDDGG